MRIAGRYRPCSVGRCALWPLFRNWWRWRWRWRWRQFCFRNCARQRRCISFQETVAALRAELRRWRADIFALWTARTRSCSGRRYSGAQRAAAATAEPGSWRILGATFGTGHLRVALFDSSIRRTALEASWLEIDHPGQIPACGPCPSGSSDRCQSMLICGRWHPPVENSAAGFAAQKSRDQMMSSSAAGDRVTPKPA